MLRTMELIVGVGPLSQFDAAATPMLNSFSQRPNLASYEARRPTVSFSRPNGPDAPMAAESARQDISHLDRVDSQVFNEAIWKSVRGAGSEMPAPVTHLRTNDEREEAEEAAEADE